MPQSFGRKISIQHLAFLLVGTFGLLGQASASNEFNAISVHAISALQEWYNVSTGLWETAGWWNGANILTMLADAYHLNSNLSSSIRQIFEITYNQASLQNPFVVKSPDAPLINSITYWGRPRSPRCSNGVPTSNGFLNHYYDDEGWWALAWIMVYDVTNDHRYLQTAVDIFQDMVKGYNATCGGIWWSKSREENTAIANELFLAVSTQVALRASNQTFYKEWAFKQWDWFNGSGLIDEEHDIIDGIDIVTCQPQEGTIWTYTHGVILGALIDLSLITKSGSYLELAEKIARAAIGHFSDKNGILHEPCEPNCGNDGPQFKGIFLRNLQTLQAATNNAELSDFILRNALSIWKHDRSERDQLGLIWSGPYVDTTASAHGSACDAIVAAAAVSSAKSGIWQNAQHRLGRLEPHDFGGSGKREPQSVTENVPFS